jgi:hypothetical protein
MFPSTPRFSKWSLQFRFSNQNIVCLPKLSHACYMTRPSHSPWFDHPDDVWWSVLTSHYAVFSSLPPLTQQVNGKELYFENAFMFIVYHSLCACNFLPLHCHIHW